MRVFHDYDRVLKELHDLKQSKFCGCIIEREHILHVSVLPHEKENLILHVYKKLSCKRGLYDSVLGGFVLSVRNFLILNTAEVLSCGSACHIDIKAMFDIYQPKIDSKTVVEIKKTLVPFIEYEAVFLNVCEVVIKMTSPTWWPEDVLMPLIIKDFNLDCEKPVFICKENNTTINQ